ncbi:NAD-dependent epimerase/dehydratase family protein [Nitrosopumilus sp. S6]
MKIFVTGGTGFIGRYIVKSLLENNDVTVYENFSNSSKENLSFFSSKIPTIVEGDLSDFELLKKSLHGFDLVIHLAAKIDISESLKRPEISNKVNVLGTINLLKACVETNTKNFIGASSAAIYGDPKQIPVTEETVPNPVSPYGADKLSMESYIRAFANAFDMNSISLRFFNVYGKGQSNEYAGVITKFIEKLDNNESLIIFGDGKNTRDYIYIDDLVQGVLDAISHLSGKKGEVYNLASGVSTSVTELAKTMMEISKKDVKIIYDPPRRGDLLFSEVLISKAKNELGFSPKFNLKSGLDKMLENR